jgi:Xaa-Pro aminopeptidase
MLLNAPRAEGVMRDAGLDALVVATQENLLYATGVLNVNAFVLPRMVQAYAVVPRDRLDAPSLVMGVGDADQALSAFPGVGPLYTFGSFYREAPQAEALNDEEVRLLALTGPAGRRASPAEALAAAIRDAGLERATLGLDEEGLAPGIRAQLVDLLPGARLVDASALIRRIRMVKTAGEIARLRRAQAACERGIAAVAAMARRGVTEREMVAAYTAAVAQAGGRVTFALIKVGRNAALGQLPPTDTPLRPGDHVWFDVGAQVEGYHADLARVLVLGEPTPKLRAFYRAALEGEERAFAITRPGLPADRLFHEVVETVRAAGIRHYRRHHVGHGIGVEVYDPPVLNDAAAMAVEAGMVINVETPYYELGWGAVHVEDPYLVGPDGRNEWLTTMSRELILVG